MVDLTKKKTLGEYETGALSGGDTVVTYRSTNAVGEKIFRGDIVAGTAASIADGTSTALKMYSDKELKDSLNTGAIPVGTKAQIITGTDTTAKLYKAADINGAVKDIAVAQYAGRTAMKAATGLTAGDVVYLSEGGRSGLFEYLVGDYSAEVAADTMEGVYVELDGVDASVGVLKRRLNGYVTPEMFGWIGTGDIHGALQSAYAYQSTNTSCFVEISGSSQISCSDQIDINHSGSKTLIKTSMALTKTSKSCLFLFAGTSLAPLDGAEIRLEPGVEIDGNGSNVVGYTYSTSDTAYAAIRFEYVNKWRGYGGTVRNGLCNTFSAFKSPNGRWYDGEFAEAVHDNGVGISRDPDNYDAADMETWNRSKMINCAMRDNEDFGAAAFDATAVKFIHCESFGNGTNLGHLSVPEGGGFSYEDDNATPNVKNYKRGGFFGCNASQNINSDFFVTGDGVHIDDKCTSDGVSITWAGANPDFYGNGVTILNADDLVCDLEISDAAKNGIYALGSTKFIGLETNARITGSGGRGLMVRGAQSVTLSSNFSSSGNTGRAVDIVNTSYNPGAGEVTINGVSASNNDGSAVYINGLLNVSGGAIKGRDNVLVGSDAAVEILGTTNASIDGVSMPSSGSQVYAARIQATVTNGALRNVDGDGSLGISANLATNFIGTAPSISTATGWTDSTAEDKFNNLLEKLESSGFIEKT